jgi:hypothetical protein
MYKLIIGCSLALFAVFNLNGPSCYAQKSKKKEQKEVVKETEKKVQKKTLWWFW